MIYLPLTKTLKYNGNILYSRGLSAIQCRLPALVPTESWSTNLCCNLRPRVGPCYRQCRYCGMVHTATKYWGFYRCTKVRIHHPGYEYKAYFRTHRHLCIAPWGNLYVYSRTIAWGIAWHRCTYKIYIYEIHSISAASSGKGPVDAIVRVLLAVVFAWLTQAL